MDTTIDSVSGRPTITRYSDWSYYSTTWPFRYGQDDSSLRSSSLSSENGNSSSLHHHRDEVELGPCPPDGSAI